MRLCLECGELDWLAAMKRIHPAVVTGWLKFDALEPIGDRRRDHRAITMTSIIAQGLHSMAADENTPPLDVDDIRNCIAPPADHDWWNEVMQQADDVTTFDETPEQRRARELREQASFR